MYPQNKFHWIIIVGLLTCGCHANSTTRAVEKTPLIVAEEKIVFSPDKINFITNADPNVSGLAKGRNLLVLRYSSRNCWSCVEDCLNVIRNETRLGKIDKQSVVIFASEYNQRDFMLFHKNYLNDYVVYHLKSEIGLKMERLNYPFLFISDSNRVIKETYMPEKHKHIELKTYLSRVSKQYLKK